MAAKALPANENTSTDFRNWIIKESVGNESGAHIDVTADQDYTQYDMIIVPHTPPESAWCGIMDHGVAEDEDTTMHVTEGIQIDSLQIAPASTFTVFGQQVWYDPITKLYSDTEDAGLWLVGYVIIATNTQGVMRFEKRRYAVPGEAT